MPGIPERFCSALFCGAMLVALTVNSADAQRVRGSVRQAGGNVPVPGALVVARDGLGHELTRTTADSTGRFDLALPSAGSYRVSALRIGFHLVAEGIVTVKAGETIPLNLEVGVPLAALAPVRVRGTSSCSGDRTGAAVAAESWERARIALASLDPMISGGALQATALTFDESLDATADSLRYVTATTHAGETTRPFGGMAPDSIAVTGFVRTDGHATEYYAPDAEILLSSSFAATHCFQAEPSPRAFPDWAGVRITSEKNHGDRADISGVLWLDRATSELRALDYTYTNVPDVTMRAGAGGHVEFAHLSSGRSIVGEWWIRMPQKRIERNLEGVGLYQKVVDRDVISGIQVMGGDVVMVEEHGDTTYRSPAHTLVLTVRRGADPVTSASVELLGVTAPVRLDASGRATFRAVQPGTYRGRVSFAPVAGEVAEPQDVVVAVRGDVDISQVNVAVTRVVASTAAAGTGTIIGRVMRARDSLPLGNALVTVEGTELAARTSIDGTYQIRGVTAGDRAIRVARIGYHPTIVRETVSGQTPTDIGLYELPDWLDAVVIKGERRDIPPYLQDVYRRGESGFGSFFTIEDIERTKSYDIKSLVGTIPGVSWNDKGIEFARCRQGELGSSAPPQSKDGIRVIVPVNSDKVQVYVDGMKMTRDPTPGDNYYTSQFSPLEVMKQVNIRSIQAVEVYRGVAEIPAEFLDDACAVIAIWTRRY